MDSSRGLTMARKKPQPRWYVDADTLGLAHVLIRARPDVTYCGDQGERRKQEWTIDPCVIQQTETTDEVWIPTVTKAGLAIITRDKHIETRMTPKRIKCSRLVPACLRSPAKPISTSGDSPRSP